MGKSQLTRRPSKMGAQQLLVHSLLSASCASKIGICMSLSFFHSLVTCYLIDSFL